MRLKTTLVLIAWFAASCKSGISEEQRKQLVGALDTAVAAAQKLEGQRAKGTGAFFGQAEVPNARCNKVVLFGHPYTTSRGNGRVLALGDKNWNVSAVPLADVANIKGLRLKAVESAAKLLRAQLTGQGLPPTATPINNERGLQYANKRIRELGDVSWYPFEIIYATMKMEQKLPYEGKFYPSFIQGRVMVWDYQAGKVACSGQAEGKFYGNAKVAVRRGQAASKTNMLWAVEHSLRDVIYCRALQHVGVGVGKC